MGEKIGDMRSMKWLLTINNPANHGVTNESIEEALQSMASFRYACYSHEIGLEKLTPHIHIFVAFENQVRLSTLKNKFPAAHCDKCRGSIKENKDYVFKEGKWKDTEKEDSRIEGMQFEIGIAPLEVGQGHRSDLDKIEELLDSGYTPEQIFELSLSYRNFEKQIRAQYMAKRQRETPVYRDVRVVWHVGESGTGKSYTMVNMIKERPNDVYVMSDYQNGGLDLYEGQALLFMDEFRGQIRFNTLLNLLDGYKMQIHCRFANIYALWTEVHITSVLPPELVYKKMVEENQDLDTVKQLLRRISEVVYHYKQDGEYKTYSVAGDSYKDYDRLKSDAGFDGFKRSCTRWEDVKEE